MHQPQDPVRDTDKSLFSGQRRVRWIFGQDYGHPKHGWTPGTDRADRHLIA